jgi:hypothetical protein
MALVWQVEEMHPCTTSSCMVPCGVALLAAAQRWQPIWLLVGWLLDGCWLGDLDQGDPVWKVCTLSMVEIG